MNKNKLILSDRHSARKLLGKDAIKAVDDVVGEVNDALKRLVFAALESGGYKVSVIQEGDFGYSCMKNSCVHFRLSRVWKGWRFGMYLYGERLLDDSGGGEPVMTIFCQHDTVIDKFYPSRCELRADVDKWEMDRLFKRGTKTTDWKGRQLKASAIRTPTSLAAQIRLHPFVSFALDGRLNPLDGHPIVETLQYVGKERLVEAGRSLSVKALTAYAKPRVAIARRLPCVEECTFVDRGEHWYPRMVVRCRLRGKPSERELEAIDRLFPKDFYGGTSWTEGLRVEITGSVDGKELRFTVKDDDE